MCTDFENQFLFDFAGYCCSQNAPKQDCSLCSNSSLVRDVDLQVASCREIADGIAYLLNPVACGNFQSSYSELCCLDQDECLLCDGNFDVGKMIPSQEAMTCGFLDAVPLERFNQTCSTFRSTFAYYCGCPDAVPGCSVCADGTVGEPNRKIFGLNNVTCGDLDDIASLVPEGRCTNLSISNFTQDAQIEFDIAAYCGCGGDTEPTGNCSLCGGDSGAVARPDAIVPDSGGFSCAELAEFAASVSDPAACTALGQFSTGCCETTPSCSVCGGPESNIAFANRTISFAEDATCEELDAALAFAPNGTCQDVLGAFPISVQSWCGCTGYDVPEQCPFCIEGTAVADAALTVPNAGVTCGEAQEIARHVTNETVCAGPIAAVASFCCSEEETASPP